MWGNAGRQSKKGGIRCLHTLEPPLLCGGVCTVGNVKGWGRQHHIPRCHCLFACQPSTSVLKHWLCFYLVIIQSSVYTLSGISWMFNNYLFHHWHLWQRPSFKEGSSGLSIYSLRRWTCVLSNKLENFSHIWPWFLDFLLEKHPIKTTSVLLWKVWISGTFSGPSPTLAPLCWVKAFQGTWVLA